MEELIIYKASDRNSSLRQGEILTGVIQYKPIMDEIPKEFQELSFIPIKHPYVIVITQDCDLDWDYKARQPDKNQPSKLLNSVILCEISTAIEIRNRANEMNRKEWELVAAHRHERF